SAVESRKKILGFIGLGAMGLPMAHNILSKSGETMFVYDVAARQADSLVEHGAVLLSSQREVLERSDVAFICLPTNALVEETLRLAMAALRPGACAVDFSSTAPRIIREAGEAGRLRGVHLVDAPVSGGTWGAREGTLSVMWGGGEAAGAIALPYMQMVGARVTHMGPGGSGALTKIVNNMVVGVHLGALAEGLAFAKKAGLDPARAFEAMRGGFAASAVMEAKAPLMLEHRFDAQARISVHLKDLANAMDTAAELGVTLPLSERVYRDMLEMESLGLVHQDQAGIVQVREREMGVDLSEP
ncbi:MAG TPA: NAD(P)-binding domain-containing protein, partial [Candidatus Limnocylindria bacterium]|nr:NAD(P)-binding domain-containing protein [Candidatus Limnocylindria bacterium]